MIQATLCFLLRGDPPHSILLGYKKRGLGTGQFAGFGGKVQQGETLVECAVRELTEESGCQVSPDALDYAGFLDFFFPFKTAWEQQVHVFLAAQWQEEPGESEEMRPQWFDIHNIPYDRMWQDNRFWLPMVLEGRKIQAQFTYQPDNQHVESYQIAEYFEEKPHE